MSKDWCKDRYASRSHSDYERRYSKTEKEAIARTSASEKCSDYILGKHLTIKTDQEHLVPILGSKALDHLTPRIQRLSMRLMHFCFDVINVPGRELITVYTRSV